MTRREREHYEIAKRFGLHRPFTRLEFNSLYRQEYAERASPPIPTDFCINLYAKSAERFPKFLRWLGRGRYEFIDDQPGQALLQFQTDHYRKMAPILTAEDVVRRIAAECAYVDERGGVGIRLEPAAEIVRQYGEQFRRAPRRRQTQRASKPPRLL